MSFEVEKGVVSTVFEMSPARASQTTPQKPAIPDKPRIDVQRYGMSHAMTHLMTNDLMTINDDQ